MKLTINRGVTIMKRKLCLDTPLFWTKNRLYGVIINGFQKKRCLHVPRGVSFHFYEIFISSGAHREKLFLLTFKPFEIRQKLWESILLRIARKHRIHHQQGRNHNEKEDVPGYAPVLDKKSSVRSNYQRISEKKVSTCSSRRILSLL